MIEGTKTCSKCKLEKSVLLFYKKYNSEMRRPACKKCMSEYAKKNYPNKNIWQRAHRKENVELYRYKANKWRASNVIHVNKVQSEYRKSNGEKIKYFSRKYVSKNKETIKIYSMLMREMEPKKEHARKKINELKRNGLLVSRDVCEFCEKEKKTNAHHYDYSKPLDVVWLCSVCHGIIHRKYHGEKAL